MTARRGFGLLAALALLAGCTPAGLDGFWVEVHGRVVDEDDAAVNGATVVLATAAGESVAEVRTTGDGEWRAPLYGTELDGNVLVALVRAGGYAEGRATFEVNVRSADTTTLLAGPGQTWDATSRTLATVRLAEEADVAFVSGRVLDAVTGDPVAGVPLSLQAGANARIGDSAVGAGETSATGEFRFEATKAGAYTVTAAASGEYGAARFPAFLTATGGRAVGLLGAPVGPGQLRASVSWGDSPFDLDLHLSAPLKGGIAGADGTGQYHLWSGATSHPERGDEADREAWIERTDADGQGPETVWISSLAVEGVVRLSVFDNDNRSDDDTTALAGSDAVLQVWAGEDTPRYWSASPGEVGTAWRPVEIDVETLLTYSVESWSVGSDPADPEAF
ncbi:MAG: carboxypeptidase-like regulatory domain-containing protein [Pseudomonadota bacterium]|nr:carboxypeptidase-like regulatory domain-containing protein [Pseudomonadota bacterium]